MIRQCEESDLDAIWEVINDGAQAYKGIIPEDRWPDQQDTPYMPKDKLKDEIAQGVIFWGFESDGILVGVMGSQVVDDVTLIRHAYVRSSDQKQGVGTQLLSHLLKSTVTPVLVGTWTHAVWAIHFYESHGFALVDSEVKTRLLNRYWKVPERQIETSVVLADQKWMSKLE